MVKGRKAKISKTKKKCNKKIMFIISFCMLLIILGIYYIVKDSYSMVRLEYYNGGYKSINYAVNLIDELDNKSNKVISPFNINSNLSLLLNATDNKTYNEIKWYFKNTGNLIDKEYINKIKEISIVEEKNEFNVLYEEYIKAFRDNEYDKYTINNINSLDNEGKKDLQLLLKKMSLTYDRLRGKNIISKDAIVKYTLTEKEIIQSEHSLKILLDNVLSDTEEYEISNRVINYTGIYSKGLDKDNVTPYFKNKLVDYHVDINNVYDNMTISNKLKELTNGKIKRMGNIDILDKELVLLNTLYFDYTWENSYSVNQVGNSVFYNIDGSYNAIQMMYSEESIYLENDLAVGFIKYFKDKKYSFIAILPKDIKNLSSINIEGLIKSAKKRTILVGLPKFEYNYEIDLKKIHEDMGIKEIYSDKANLTRMTDLNLKINDNIQRISISIGEHGTEASYVNHDYIDTFTYDEDVTKVFLDHPFMFIILDNDTNDCMLIGKVVKL